MSTMYITTEDTCENDDKGQLTCEDDKGQVTCEDDDKGQLTCEDDDKGRLTCEDDDKGQLIDVVKSESDPIDPIDGGTPSGIEIKVESDTDDGNVEGQVEWAEMKIEPCELTCGVPMSSQCTKSSNRPVLNDEPPEKKVKLGEEEPGKSPEGCSKTEDFPPREKFGLPELVKQLVDIHPMFQSTAIALLESFLDKLLEWVASKPEYLKLHMYELRLEVARVALSMDIAGFMPNDRWFINFKNQFPGRFACYSQKHKNYDDNVIKQVAKWYHAECAKHRVVSPGQLERATYDFGEKMGKEPCYLSKDEVRLFVEQQGLYCKINGEVCRLMKVKGGLLRHFFEFKFETWYHGRPTSTEDLLQNVRHLGEEHWTIFRSYFAILSEWLVHVVWLVWSLSKYLSISDIDNTETKFAEVVFGSDVEVCRRFYKALTAKIKKEIHVIQTFNSKFGEQFCYRSYALCSDHLKKNAEELALIMGYSDLFITRDWLRRFAELTVGCSLTSDRKHDHPRDADNHFPLNGVGFEVTFQHWYSVGSPKNVEGFAGRNTQPSSLRDIIASNPKPLNNYVAFLVEVSRWYRKQSIKGFVKPYELKEKSEEVAALIGLTFFKATKVWMNRFTMLKGLKYYNERNGTVTLIEGRQSPGEEFTELFEAWYSEGTCLKCAQRGLSEPHDGRNPAQSLLTQMNEKRNIQALQSNTKAIAKTAVTKPTVPKPAIVEPPPDSAASGEEKVDAQPSKSADAQPSNSVDVCFESVIHSWYIKESASANFAPGHLEKNAMEVANRLGVKHFIPHKTWIEGYVGQNGLGCHISGCRRLLTKSEFDFLKCKFSSEFEMWYHQWPLTLEETMLKGDDDAGSNASFEAYGQAVLNWYVEVSEVGKISPHDIKTKSDAIIKKKLPGITPQDVDVWTRRWCRKHNYVTQRIRSFDFAMRMWYIENRKSGFVTAEELKMEAEKCAREKMGIPNFRATRIWLKRFVERNGIYLVTEGVAEFLSFTDILYMGGFNELVSMWYVCNPPGKCLPQSEGVVGSESSSDHLNSKGAEDVEMVTETVTEAPVATFENEVVALYNCESLKDRMSPGKYLAMILDNRKGSGLTAYSGLTWGFYHRKRCIKSLVELHGFHLGGNHKRHMFLNADCGVLKWRFELAFEVWYYSYPLHVDCVKIDGSSLGGDYLNLAHTYLSSLREWYIGLREYADVSVEEIRAKEAEIANELLTSEYQRDLIARWCREWCSRNVAWIEKIRSLDSRLGSWYEAKPYTVKPWNLSKKAEDTARCLNMQGFTVTSAWLTRFVQLHGLHFMHMGVMKDFLGFASRSRTVDWAGFWEYYNQWLETDKANFGKTFS